MGSEKAQTVLIAEDEPSVRELIAFLLEREGYTVLKARHAQEALFFSGEFPGPIHLLLTDLDMGPHGNGCQLAQALREHRPNLKVLYISGWANDDGLQEEVLLGQAAFLPKPFSPFELLDSVRKALEVTISTL